MTVRVIAAAAATAGLVVIGVATPTGMASAGTISAGRSFTVTAKISKHSIILGKRVRVSGAVAPTYPRQTVQLQHLVGKHWKTIATRAVRDGRYQFRTSPTRAGTWAYRVTTSAHRARRGGHSPIVRVGVYRWHNLADLTPVTGGWQTGVAEINGTKYRHSLLDTGGYGPVGYNLARKCSTLKGVAGLRDDSSADDTYQFEIDGVTGQLNTVLLEVTLQLGQDQPFTIDVTNLLRANFGATFLSGSQTNPDVPAYGTPRILCRF